jgi:SH3 domain protein
LDSGYTSDTETLRRTGGITFKPAPSAGNPATKDNDFRNSMIILPDSRTPTRLATGLILFASLSLQTAFAQPGHVADDVYTFYHSGPSNQYRIAGRIRSGDAVEIIKRDASTDYVQVKLENGRTGWLPGDQITEGQSTLARLPELQSALNEKSTTVVQQADEIVRLRSELTDIKTRNQSYDGERDQLNRQIKDLNNQIENMDDSNLMRWLTHGGLVALGGVLLGLLIPYFPKRRKRNADWF